MPEQRFTIEHRPEEGRYVLLDSEPTAAAGGDPVIGEESYVDVVAADGTVERVLFHTAVSEAYAGQGLASVLVGAVVADLVAAGIRIVPVCPYVKAWLPKHPEFADHVVAVRGEHLRAVRDRQGG
ncbi:GNAT family N-acetyltransferase [Leucobacter soli]|uniref:N-acetyltransferase domain-containing protein n=1 Tax=Leucobacter soli TaxID=2812850 RepID=A0A916K0L0_9MICO|nr:GNAT family N-acetyltransferase [Leucobacter soli]CAG7621323.1 hypothetical protein LEUCIP111803_02424 [Leucobacter soli]